jgi:glucose-1-phosphate thymidylyltransferase
MAGARNQKIKGVILAGGLGTRLYPLTKITNKHLLPVYDKPMILYPLETLKCSGITDILLVTGREYASHFMNFLGSGEDLGVSLSYAIQDKNNGGIADALKYAQEFSNGGSIAVILGDNIFEQHFKSEVETFNGGAMMFFKEVEDPTRFGVPVFDSSGTHIVRIEEKPKEPQSTYAQTGFYLYDEKIFDYIKNLTPSGRGELEITDVNNAYLQAGQLSFAFIKGFWSDAGTFESLLRAGIEQARVHHESI